MINIYNTTVVLHAALLFKSPACILTSFQHTLQDRIRLMCFKVASQVTGHATYINGNDA